MSQNLPAVSDLNATWSFVQPSLEYLLGAQEDHFLTPKMYINCYTAIYNYCVNKSRHGIGGTSKSNSVTGNYSYSGAEIYARLDAYLVDFIERLEKDPNESFLAFYVRRWTRFVIGAVYLNNVFDYMNRYWVQKERSDGRRDVFDVNTLALLKWKSHMFNNNADRLIDEVLDLIERQRNNEIVDTNYISTAIKSLIYLGIDVQDLKKPNLVVYIKHFEHKFLEKTAEYYSKESTEFLATHNLVDYMKKCGVRLSEEVSRSNSYLEDHTKKYLLDTLNTVLIKNHAEAMYNQFLVLLERDEIDNILIMYKLLSRVPSTLQPLADTLEQYIKDKASKYLEQIKNSAEASEEHVKSGEAKNLRKSLTGVVTPKTYIQALVSIYSKFNGIVSGPIKKDPIFIKSLDNACRFFVNKNAIASSSPKSACKTPEYLARYADTLLKLSSKETEIIDMSPNIMMIILKFIDDKDAFEEHYRRLLAKRLINGNSRSEELEESIIQQLQEENSMEYTSKMTKMFQDMKASEDLKYQFKEDFNLVSSAVKDFTPMILALSMWPFKYLEEYQLKLAPELLPTFEKVQEIYNKKHTGRQLQWLWNHGKSEVKANLSRKGKPPFIFTVSNVQLMILLAFNKSKTFTFDKLLDTVGVAEHTFEAHLLPFVKYKLLEQEPPGSEAFKRPNTVFTIVDEYKSKKLRVNFVSSIKTEQRQEEEDANEEIDESRRNYLAACIIRIMKARKQMKHNELVNEVASQSISRFRAKVLDIKKVIDSLIEKEYLHRIDVNVYEYLA